MGPPPPTFALVGGTGLVGGAILPSLLAALASHKIAFLRVLTASSPDDPKFAQLRGLPRVEVIQISYANVAGLEAALEGAQVLVSAMGTKTSAEGSYEENKAKLVEAAASSGVQIYVPSEFGTDHNVPAAKAIGSAMFEGKQAHHIKAEKLGLKVLSVYNGLILEISFSTWLNLDSTQRYPTWVLPTPSHPVAFTSLKDLGPFVLSATLQVYNGATDIPSRLRIYSDLITLDEAADAWEKATGGRISRTYLDSAALESKYEEIKPTLASGMLGPAIPLMISQGVFAHGGDSANAVLLRGEWAFAPRKVEDFFEDLPNYS